MKLRSITSAERRTILVATFLGWLVLLPTRILPAWRGYRGEQSTVAREVASELAQAEASVSRLYWLRDSLVARRERYLALAPRLLSGGTPSAAGATLAAHVSRAASGAGVRIDAMEIRADTALIARFARVAVHVTVTCDVRGLTDFLLALERGPLLLGVERIDISAMEPTAPSTQPETLQVALAISGLAVVPFQRAEL